MSGLPYNKHPCDLFVSYSHADAAFVGPLVKWLRDVAGLRVWWDTNRLLAGERLAAALPAGLASARGALFCVSRGWNGSSWCEDEYNAALQERRSDRRYRVVALRLDDSPVPTFLSNARYLEMRALEPEPAADLLEAFVPEPAPWSSGERDVYLSRSWHPTEPDAADHVGPALVQNHGFRLVGDSPDYAAFEGGNRIERIIESCGGLVAVFPLRDDPANGFTSKWILQEVKAVRALGRPYLLFAPDGVRLDEATVEAAVGRRVFPVPRTVNDAGLVQALALFDEKCRPSPRIAYSFFATSLNDRTSGTDRLVTLMERVTGMQCLLGQQLQGQHAQQEIVDRIRNAQFVLADISAPNLNSLVEAGIARGAGTRLHLISSVPESGELGTRFMFRDLEINWYRHPVERIGAVHRIARMYRRRVFNPAVRS